jgi:hypothetical protein
MKTVATLPKREINCSEKNWPTIPCLIRPIEDINMIKKPKKTLRSFNGDLILAKRKAAKNKSNGTKAAPNPK